MGLSLTSCCMKSLLWFLVTNPLMNSTVIFGPCIRWWWSYVFVSCPREGDILVGCTAVGFLWVFVASSRDSVFLVEYFLFLVLVCCFEVECVCSCHSMWFCACDLKEITPGLCVIISLLSIMAVVDYFAHLFFLWDHHKVCPESLMAFHSIVLLVLLPMWQSVR